MPKQMNKHKNYMMRTHAIIAVDRKWIYKRKISYLDTNSNSDSNEKKIDYRHIITFVASQVLPIFFSKLIFVYLVN